MAHEKTAARSDDAVDIAAVAALLMIGVDWCPLMNGDIQGRFAFSSASVLKKY